MASADPLLGETIDERWKVIEQIGAGGFGTVYRAERVKLGKSVAIKFLDERCAQSKEAVARFDREARAISRVHHAHCVGILDFGVWRQRPYIVMEYVRGKRLGQEIGKPSFTLERAVGITRQLLEGLRHAHAHGVVHRDLKPDNVMLMEVTGNADFVKILDFGLARIISVDEPSLSLQPHVAGTPSYMSPEQTQAKKVDHRTDLYSLGVMLFAMCTGKRPFSHEDDLEVLRMHLKTPPPSPRKVAPERNISAALERVILRALEKDRERRFFHAEEFLEALAATPEGRSRARRPARRAAGALVGASVLALVAVAAWAALLVRDRLVRARPADALPVAASPLAPARPVVAARPPAPAPPAKPAVAAPAPPPAIAPDALAAPPTVAAADPAVEESPSAVAAPPAPPKLEIQAPPAPPSEEKQEAPAPPPADEKKLALAPAPPPPTTDAKKLALAQSTTDAKKLALAPAQSTTDAKKLARAPAPPTTDAKTAAAPAPTADAKKIAVAAEEGEPPAIAALVAAGKLDAAQKALLAAAHTHPRAAWVHRELGEIYFRRLWRRDAADEWDEALRLDPLLRTDARLGEHLCAALAPPWKGAGERLLETRFAGDALAPMKACLGSARDLLRVQAAARVIEKVAGPSAVDRALVALRTLELADNCADRRAAVDTLGRLHDPRAVAPLTRLEAARVDPRGRPVAEHACLGAAVQKALAASSPN